MSVKALTWAFATPLSGNDKCVLLALADFANDQGVCWPAQETTAAKAGVSLRTVQRIVPRLEAAGYLYREARFLDNGHRTTDLTVLRVPGHRPPATLSPDNLTTRQIVQGPPANSGGAEPSREPSAEASPLSTNAGASAQVEMVVLDAPKPKLPKLGGKPVVAESWELALRVLNAFNEAASRKYRALKSSGAPSEAASYIYRRIREYPDLTYAEHVGIIQRTIASRWWDKTGSGEPPSFNVVYGPRVFEENITRPGIAAPPRRLGRDDHEGAARLREMREAFGGGL